MVFEGRCGVVESGVVRHFVYPAGPDDTYPCSGEDADGVGMVFAGGAGVVVDLGGPGAGVPTVAGEGVIALRNRLLQAQRKCTARCLPDSLVTGVTPARAATESGPA